MFNTIPMEKAWFMVPIEYNHNGKNIMVPMKYILIIYSLDWKGMVLWKIVFEIGNLHGER